MTKLNITPAPWMHFKSGGDRIITDADGDIDICKMLGPHKFGQDSDAEAIVKAVNGTYGIGVDPEAIENMKVALHEFINWAEKNAMWDKIGQSYYRAKAAIEKAKL